MNIAYITEEQNQNVYTVAHTTCILFSPGKQHLCLYDCKWTLRLTTPT